MVRSLLGGPPLAAVAAGGAHTVALDADGAVHTWGLNDKGQLGLGHDREETELGLPQEVPMPERCVALAAGKEAGGDRRSRRGSRQRARRSLACPVKAIRLLLSPTAAAAGARHDVAHANPPCPHPPPTHTPTTHTHPHTHPTPPPLQATSIPSRWARAAPCGPLGATARGSWGWAKTWCWHESRGWSRGCRVSVGTGLGLRSIARLWQAMVHALRSDPGPCSCSVHGCSPPSPLLKPRTLPALAPPTDQKVVALAAGMEHSLALTAGAYPMCCRPTFVRPQR